MKNVKIFKVDLLSITPDIKVYIDRKMEDNIVEANTTVVEHLIVKKARWQDGFREILTNKFIPVFYETTIDNYTLHGRKILEAPKSPVFVRVERTKGTQGYTLRDNLKSASVEDLKTYAFDHINREDFARKLDEIFKTGEAYYNESKAKNEVTEETQIKRWLKTIKRCNKI